MNIMKLRTLLKILIPLATAGVLALVAYIWLGLGPYVQGSINYNLDGTLPPGSTLAIELRDTSYQDASSRILIRRVIVDPGPPPHSFKINYGSLAIDASATYSVSVRVEGPNTELFFINDIAHDVITGGNPKRVDIELVPVLPLP